MARPHTELRPPPAPIVDLDPLGHSGPTGVEQVAAGIRDACEGTGFFYIVNHGVPPALLEAVFAENARFHALPLVEKLELRLNSHFRGYQPIGGSTLRISTVEPARRGNHSESFFIRHEAPTSVGGRNPIDGPNQWPRSLDGFRETVTAYHDALTALGVRLLSALAGALEEPADTFRQRWFEPPSTTLRLMHYPPHPQARPEDLYGIAPHSDYGFLTLLAQDEAGGLEIRLRGGEWVAVPPIPDSFVVNVGDALARMTNDRFASTPHRVINPQPAQSRYSVPFFFDPALDTTIDCLPAFRRQDAPCRHPPVRYGDYYLERLATNFYHRKPG